MTIYLSFEGLKSTVSERWVIHSKRLEWNYITNKIYARWQYTTKGRLEQADYKSIGKFNIVYKSKAVPLIISQPNHIYQNTRHLSYSNNRRSITFRKQHSFTKFTKYDSNIDHYIAFAQSHECQLSCSFSTQSLAIWWGEFPSGIRRPNDWWFEWADQFQWQCHCG